MRLALIALSLGLLTGCEDKAEPSPERRSAAGEVLGGEVSDDMLPLDTVRSTSPSDATPSGDPSSMEGQPTRTQGPTASQSGPAAADPAATSTIAEAPDEEPTE